MKISKWLKQVFCKHKNIDIFANIYGDLINDFDGARTVYVCKDCGKRFYKKEYKLAPFNYNKFLGVAYKLQTKQEHLMTFDVNDVIQEEWIKNEKN